MSEKNDIDKSPTEGDKTDDLFNQKISRRAAIAQTGKVFIAVGVTAVVAGAAGALAGSSLSGAKTTTETATSTTTATATKTATSTATQTVTNTATSTATQTLTSTATATETATSTSTLTTTDTALANQLAQITGFTTLTPSEQVLVEKLAETIIPSDSNGPGAKEAGVVYFIDKQLEGKYGYSGNMYMQPPFVMPNQTGPITVDGITYPGGSSKTRQDTGVRYQYSRNLREFWRIGLIHLQEYSNSAFGGNFETLSAANQTQALTDLWNNKPTNFGDIIPQDFFTEIHNLSIMGYFADPIYGGNKNMVSWTYTGHSGVNQGNFYGENMDVKQLMVATTPTRLKPASITQLQSNPTS